MQFFRIFLQAQTIFTKHISQSQTLPRTSSCFFMFSNSLPRSHVQEPFWSASAMNGTFKVGTAETRKVGPAAQGRCDSRRQLRGWTNLAFRRDHFRDKPFSNIQIRYCKLLCYIYSMWNIHSSSSVPTKACFYKEIMSQHFTAFSNFNIF